MCGTGKPESVFPDGVVRRVLVVRRGVVVVVTPGACSKKDSGEFEEQERKSRV